MIPQEFLVIIYCEAQLIRSIFGEQGGREFVVLSKPSSPLEHYLEGQLCRKIILFELDAERTGFC